MSGLELAIELVLGQAGDASQEVALGLAADGRRRLRQLEIDARGCQAREQRIAQRGGYAEVRVADRVERGATLIEGFGGPHELLQEQRHPVAPLDERVPLLGRQSRSPPASAPPSPPAPAPVSGASCRRFRRTSPATAARTVACGQHEHAGPGAGVSSSAEMRSSVDWSAQCRSSTKRIDGPPPR